MDQFEINNNVLELNSKEITEHIVHEGIDETIIDNDKTVLAGHKEITSVIIREGIVSIAPHAFENCINLKRITLPSTLEKICEAAFSGCQSLEEVHIASLSSWLSVSLPTGYQSETANPLSGDAKMYIDGRLCEDIVIPEEITTVRTSLRNYKHMKKLAIPDHVQRIVPMAFQGCSSLETVELPCGLTEICEGLFNGCENLTSVTLPDGCIRIGQYAFRGCSALKSITFPASLQTIGKKAFDRSGITAIIIPGNIRRVEEEAFSFCRNLKSITVAGKETGFGNGVFSDCESLENICLPGGIECLNPGMFSRCNLKTFTIPDTVQKLCHNSLSGNRFAELFIPDSVHIIDCCAFAYGHGYTETETVTAISIPGTVDQIDKDAFGYGFSGGKWHVNLTIRGHKVDSALSKFLNANKEQLNIVFSDALPGEIPAKYRHRMTDYWAKKIRDDETVEQEIYQSYLKYLKAHKSEWIDKPSEKGEAVLRFMMREGLLNAAETDELIRKLEELPELKASLIDYQNRSFTLDDYEKEYDKEFKRIQREAEIFSEPGSQKYINAMWTVSRNEPYVKTLKYTEEVVEFPRKVGNKEITGIADGFTFMKDGKKETGLLMPSAATVTDIVIPDTYTCIGKDAFRYCNKGINVSISSLEQWLKIRISDEYSLPQGFNLICGGKRIAELIIPGSCQEINDYQFRSAAGIQRIKIRKGVKKIGKNAFAYCPDLLSVEIPAGLTDIGQYAFGGCDNLKEVHLASITDWTRANVESALFRYGADLYLGNKPCDILTIPEGTERISRDMFRGCSNIREVILPESVTDIAVQAFSGCTGLRLVIIPNPKTEIGLKAFEGCSAAFVCRSLNADRLRAFPRGANIYTHAHPKIAANRQYRIRPIENFSREKLGDRKLTSPLEGYVFAVTGDIDAFPERDDLIEYIRTCGGNYSSSITKETTHLISNQKMSNTTQFLKAKQLGLPIINEEAFFNLAFPG